MKHNTQSESGVRFSSVTHYDPGDAAERAKLLKDALVSIYMALCLRHILHSITQSEKRRINSPTSPPINPRRRYGAAPPSPSPRFSQ